ncbi:MAG: DUF87 domain-containing protein [Candidatus Jordarchaeales archaeon]
MSRLRFRLSEELTINSDEEPWRTEGLRICIFGGPGSGKSYTAALLAEQFLAQGGTVVVFQPRAEYWVLKERFDVLVVGGPHMKDLDFAPVSPSSYAKAVVEKGLSMVFYTEDVEDEEKLVDFVSRFIRYTLKYEELYHRPILLIVEEAQEFAPVRASGRSAPPWVYQRMIKAFKDCFLQGRKLNVSAVAVSPRPQEVNFTVRQLANLTLYGKFSPQDVEYLDRECLKWHRQRGLKVDATKLLDLKPGEWLAIKGAEASFIRVTEPRLTRHGAETPKLECTAPRAEETSKAISALAAELSEAVRKAEEEGSELRKAKAEIRKLQAKLEEAEKEIERLKTALAVKETLKVEVKPAEIRLPEIKLAPPAVPLPKVIESLDADAKQVWTLLRQKQGLYKAEIMAAFGWGKRRLNRALRTLQNRRLVKVQARRLYALEPIV